MGLQGDWLDSEFGVEIGFLWQGEPKLQKSIKTLKRVECPKMLSLIQVERCLIQLRKQLEVAWKVPSREFRSTSGIGAGRSISRSKSEKSSCSSSRLKMEKLWWLGMVPEVPDREGKIESEIVKKFKWTLLYSTFYVIGW